MNITAGEIAIIEKEYYESLAGRLNRIFFDAYVNDLKDMLINPPLIVMTSKEKAISRIRQQIFF